MSCSISDMTAPNMAASDTTASFNSAWKYIFLLLQMGQIAYICWMKYKARHHTHRTEPTVKKRKISDGDPVLFQLPSGQIGVIPFCYDFKQTPQGGVSLLCPHRITHQQDLANPDDYNHNVLALRNRHVRR